MPEQQSIADRIKAARTKLDISQAQAAKLWEINFRTLQGWEQGQREPRGLALRALEQILKDAGV